MISLRNLQRRIQEVIQGGSRKTISVESYLLSHNVRKGAIKLIDDEKITSTESYLKGNGINANSFVVNTLEDAREMHLIRSRTIVLWNLVVPMSIIPIWLVVLLTLPSFGRTQMSEKLQLAILAAIATDYLGLYYVVTRNLFPASEACSCKKSSLNQAKDDQEKQEAKH